MPLSLSSEGGPKKKKKCSWAGRGCGFIIPGKIAEMRNMVGIFFFWKIDPVVCDRSIGHRPYKPIPQWTVLSAGKKNSVGIFFFCRKIIAPLAYQKESTVSSGISDRSSTQQPVSAVTLFAAGDCGSVSDCSLSEQHPVSAENCLMSVIRLPIVALLLNLVVVRRGAPIVVLLFQ